MFLNNCLINWYSLAIHEIPVKFRADIIYFLCQLKADTAEFSKFVKKVQKEEAKQKTSYCEA